MSKQKSSAAVSEVRVPMLIRVDRELANKFKAFSDVTGVSIAHIVREALEDFANTSLEARLESLQKEARPSNVIPIDTALTHAATASQA
jgi:hypothetical protein